MALLRTNGPYIWVTWLPRLLSGESSCEWASWFKAQHESFSWLRMTSDFDLVKWLTDHTALLNESREAWESKGYSVLTEDQNHFGLRGKTAVLAGEPDLVARKGGELVIIDAKAAKPRPAHAIQVMIYMYALPRAQERYRGLTVAGQVAYPDHVVDIPAEAVDVAFVSNVIALITRLASETPARRVPSTGECRICEITPTDCPERTDDRSPKEGTTDDF